VASVAVTEPVCSEIGSPLGSVVVTVSGRAGADSFPLASLATTVKVYDVAGVRPVTGTVAPVGSRAAGSRSRRRPSMRTSYQVVSCVRAQVSRALATLICSARRPLGTAGGRESALLVRTGTEVLAGEALPAASRALTVIAYRVPGSRFFRVTAGTRPAVPATRSPFRWTS
jgi:hypothetical protein